MYVWKLFNFVVSALAVYCLPYLSKPSILCLFKWKCERWMTHGFAVTRIFYNRHMCTQQYPHLTSLFARTAQKRLWPDVRWASTQLAGRRRRRAQARTTECLYIGGRCAYRAGRNHPREARVYHGWRVEGERTRLGLVLTCKINAVHRLLVVLVGPCCTAYCNCQL